MARRRSTYQFRLKGPRGLGDVPVREVAGFLESIAQIVAQGAAESLGRPLEATGRYPAAVEQASQVRLVSLRSGSLLAGIYTPPVTIPAGALNLDAESLAERGMRTVLDTIGSDDVAALHPRLALELVETYDRSAIRWPAAVLSIQDLRPGHEREEAIDTRRRDQLRATAIAATIRAMTGREVTGRLYEADFERRTAKVRTPTGDAVDVRFPPRLDDDIQRALRSRTTLVADVTFDPTTNRAKRVDVQEVLAGDQLGLEFEGVDFWHDPSLADLIARAGARPVVDVGALKLAGLTDAEWSDFYAAIEADHG